MLRASKVTSLLGSIVGEKKFARQTVVLLVASTLGNIFSYLYLLLAARTLTPQSFGIFGSMFGMFYIFCLLGDALRIAIASNAASLKERLGSAAVINNFRKPLFQFSLVGLLAILILEVSSTRIASFFHMDTPGPVLILGGAMLTAWLLFMVLGLLQGLQLFRWLAATGYFLPQALKLVFGLVFAWIGQGLAGLITALAMSNVIAILFGVMPLTRLANSATWGRNNVNINSSSFVGPVLLIGIIISVPTSVDVMLVTHFFSAESSGIYNAIATMGKVVLFSPIGISLVMLPGISRRYSSNTDTTRMLRLSLTYVFALCGMVVLLYWLIPGSLISLLFGKEYLDAAPLVGWYGIAMALFAANYLFAQYNLAVSNKRGILSAVTITLAEVAIIAIVHYSLLQVVMILFFGNLLLLAFNLFALGRR